MRWWRRKSREYDLEREINSHLDPESEETPGRDAHSAARRAFGNITLAKKRLRGGSDPCCLAFLRTSRRRWPLAPRY